MLCSKCNAEIPNDAKSCTKCGASLQEESQVPPSPPSPPPVAEAKTSVGYAGFWRRAMAYIIDIIIIMIPATMFLNIAGLGLKSPSFLKVYTFNTANLIYLIIMWLYFASFHSSAKQATPGKMLIKLFTGGAL